MTAPVRKPTLTLDLPPTLGIDPGAVNTGVAVRIGQTCPAAVTVVHSVPTRAGAHPDLYPMDPHGPIKVLRAAARLLTDHDAEARAWWEDRGHRLPAECSPWLIAVEKYREPVEIASRNLELTADVVGVYPASLAMAIAVGVALGEGVQWVAPHRADDRWETGRGGTGRKADYWPTNLLNRRDGGIPDRRILGGEHGGLGHVQAAFHIASAAAHDHVRTHGVRPPHEAHGTPVLLPALHTLLGAAVRPQEPLAAPARVHHAPTDAVAARTAAPVRIPAPRVPEPDPDEVLDEVLRLIAAAEASDRPVLQVVREHLDAEQPDPLDAPATWSTYERRRKALLAAAATAA